MTTKDTMINENQDIYDHGERRRSQSVIKI